MLTHGNDTANPTEPQAKNQVNEVLAGQLAGVAYRNRIFERHHRYEPTVGVDNLKLTGKVQHFAGADDLSRHLAAGLDGFQLCRLQVRETFALFVLGQPASLAHVNEVNGHGALTPLTLAVRRHHSFFSPTYHCLHDLQAL